MLCVTASEHAERKRLADAEGSSCFQQHVFTAEVVFSLHATRPLAQAATSCLAMLLVSSTDLSKTQTLTTYPANIMCALGSMLIANQGMAVHCAMHVAETGSCNLTFCVQDS